MEQELVDKIVSAVRDRVDLTDKQIEDVITVYAEAHATMLNHMSEKRAASEIQGRRQ